MMIQVPDVPVWPAKSLLTEAYVPSAYVRALFRNLLRTHVLEALPTDICCMSHLLTLDSRFLQ